MLPPVFSILSIIYSRENIEILGNNFEVLVRSNSILKHRGTKRTTKWVSQGRFSKIYYFEKIEIWVQRPFNKNILIRFRSNPSVAESQVNINKSLFDSTFNVSLHSGSYDTTISVICLYGGLMEIVPGRRKYVWKYRIYSNFIEQSLDRLINKKCLKKICVRILDWFIQILNQK